jgi:hypothetical protein
MLKIINVYKKSGVLHTSSSEHSNCGSEDTTEENTARTEPHPTLPHGISEVRINSA